MPDFSQYEGTPKNSKAPKGLAPSAPKKSNVRTPRQTEDQLVKLAAKVAKFSANPNATVTKNGVTRTKFDTTALNSQVQNAFVGYNQKQIEDVAARNGIDPATLDIIKNMTGKEKRASGLAVVTSPLMAANIPGQAALGAITEAGAGGGVSGFFKGAARGAVNQDYTPVQSYERVVNNKSRKEAIAAEKKLNPWVRFGANTGGSMLVDPSTWFSFGTTFAAKQAARTAAENIATTLTKNAAGAAAENASGAVLSKGASEIYGRLIKSGRKALSKEERAVYDKLPREIRKQGRGVTGGVRVNVPTQGSITIPGTGGWGSRLGPKGDATIAGFFQNRARVKAAEKGERVAPGTAQSVENLQAYLHGTGRLADMREEEAVKAATNAYATKVFGKGKGFFGARRTKKLGEDFFGPIRESLDVHGTPESIAALDPKQRIIFDKLNAMRMRDSAELRSTGRLQTDEVALANKQGRAAAEFQPEVDRLVGKLNTAEDRAASAADRYHEQISRLEGIKRLASARGDQKAIDRAIDREHQIQIKMVGAQQKEAQAGAAADALHAKNAEKDALSQVAKSQRDLKNIEQELKQAQARLEKEGISPSQRAALQRDVDSLSRQRDELTQGWHEAADHADSLTAARVHAEELAARAKGANPLQSSIPPKLASRPVRRASEEAPAARGLGRTEARKSAADSTARQSRANLERILGKQEAAVADQEVIPDTNYFPQYRSPEAEAMARRSPSAPAGLSGQAPGFLKERTHRGAASEAPPIAEGPHAGAPSVEQRPIVSIGRHGKETGRDTAKVKAYNDLQGMSDSTGNPLLIVDDDAVKAHEGATDLYDKISGPVTTVDDAGRRITKNKDLLVSKEISSDFKKFVNFHPQDPSSLAVLNGMRYANALWARYATATSGFISRNVIQGNIYMGMVLAGAKDPRDWASSLGLMHRVSAGIKKNANPYSLLKPKEVELVRGALEHNAVESNFMQTIEDFAKSSTVSDAKEAKTAAGRLAKTARHKVATSKASPLSVNFGPLHAVSSANQWAESWSRLSVYANKVKHGYNPADAAAIARHYMIDYGDLGKAGEMARNVNPFVTWMYKTVPLILGTAIHDPRKITIPLHILNAAGLEGENAGVTPDFITDQGGITLPKGLREVIPGMGKSPVEFIPADPVHSVAGNIKPVADLTRAVAGSLGIGPNDAQAWQKAAAGLVNTAGLGGVSGGLIQSLVEAATHTQLYSGRKVPEGSSGDLPFGTKAPWEIANALNTLMPALSRANTIAPNTEYDKKAQARRAISQLLGVTLSNVDKKSKQSEWYRRLDSLYAQLRKEDLKASDLESADGGGSIPTFATGKKK